ncbi:endonuclease/exonuclease/phosphatase family protein [Niveibacterium umoris]|uniref:Endonuclease/exonuclease/phosphatase family metal-dependent hydrolase n=1 Tax=Niveibacterium umoris TaxID=1193620 RepID=A0A840BG08_9RHOO|nr:endonuclease/exonuclease/phosphatase family protein [Niveibacterium umoris]MBB4011950.1 endonuclease/exonuclease/phosphatase family metal-dependent hydrolase [Niveibacterium umoris]
MRIVSWNIQWGRGADGHVDLARTIDVLRRLDGDVICLQEVAIGLDGLPGGVVEDGLARLCEGLPGYAAAHGPAVDVAAAAGGRASFGNLILSRRPVTQIWRHMLPWPAEAGVPSMQRACVEVVVNYAGAPLRVLTTHLEYYSAAARVAQAQRLVDLQCEACALEVTPPAGKESSAAFASRPRPSRAVLCGDFNAPPGGDAYRTVLADGPLHPWCDAWATVHGSSPHAHSVGLHGAEWPAAPYCCDFFFVSRNLLPGVASVFVEASTDASDHQPVVLDLLEVAGESGSTSPR